MGGKAAYYGMITLFDDNIGRILQALRDKGIALEDGPLAAGNLWSSGQGLQAAMTMLELETAVESVFSTSTHR